MYKNEEKLKNVARGAEIRKFKEIETARVLDMDKHGILPIGTDEMFVRVENSNTFYISNYGRGILVTDRAQLINGFTVGKKLIYQYPVWLNGEYKETERFAERLVVDTFYADTSMYKYIWHMGDDMDDNYYLNLVPVTKKEHAALRRYVQAGGFDTIDTVAEIIEETVNTPSVLDIGYWGMREVDVHHWTYIRWLNMLMRCYSDNFHDRQPNYVGCRVDERWHNYANFKAWVEENYYSVGDEPMELDKDILCKGNTVYSPENCIFVPQTINALFIGNKAARGDLPIGVDFTKGVYRARMGYSGKQIQIGSYATAEEAFEAYKVYKEKLIQEIANRYKNRIPDKLYDVLINRVVEIDD